MRHPEFNEKTGMSNPQLCKGMKFPNGKVFRVALREYAVQSLWILSSSLMRRLKFLSTASLNVVGGYMHHRLQES